MAVSKKTLRVIAGFVWLSGGFILLLKAASLNLQAIALRPGEIWPWLAVAIALLIGAFKAHFLFSGFCQKNLTRVAALTRPRLWNAFRPGFYVFLTAMILLGATLSTLASGNYWGLLALVVLDISIGIALLGSFPTFFRPQTRNSQTERSRI
ncbi:MAG: hypothetical protein K0U72_16990 [Gammaproteobacteria bacterium]|nr:hypothetical protein [Gammaproteobacteria bacterium]